MSTQTAAKFGLHVGSTFEMTGPERETTGEVSKVTVLVTGIVAPIDPTSSFWAVDPTIVVPGLQGPTDNPYWAGAVMVGPGETSEIEQYFSSAGLQLEWVFPLNVGSLTGQQVQPLSNALDTLTTSVPTITGNVAQAAPLLTTSSNLLSALNQFIATAQSVDTLLWLLYVSLVVTGLAVLLLAGRMVAMRRRAELAVIRARGASLRQIALGTAAGAALVCVPAAVLGAVLAILAVPGAGSVQAAGAAGGWWPPIAVLVVAVCGPALIAAWQQRLPKGGITDRRQTTARRRLIVEVMLIAAAVAGIVVFRNQGNQAGSGVNFYTSSAPLLVAIPVVIVVLRLYPLALRGLLRLSTRTSRAPAFLGLARASRTALTPALPAFALVLALTVAAFAGMVRDAVTNGEVAASWQTAGADAMVTPAPNLIITPNAVRAMADVPGVTHAAALWNALWETPGDTQLNVLAVDPASYAALVASSQGYPQVQAGLITVPSRAGAPQPVLASPQALADLGRGVVSLSTNQAVVAPVRVQVAGVLSSTPAFLGGGAFVIMPLAADQVDGHAAGADADQRDAAERRVHRPRAAGRGGAGHAVRRHRDLPLRRAFRADRRSAPARGLHAVHARGRSGRRARPRRHAARARARRLGTRLDAGPAGHDGPRRGAAGLGGGARGAARGYRGGGVRLGLRRGAAPGAGSGHRPVGVHRDHRRGAAGGQCRDGCGTASRPRIGRCRVAWHRDKVGTPTRRSVPSSGRMNGRTW